MMHDIRWLCGRHCQACELFWLASEYCALLRSPALKAKLSDWCYGVHCEINVRCDSNAARGHWTRIGQKPSRSRAFLVEGRLKLVDVLTSENLSDTFTQTLTQIEGIRAAELRHVMTLNDSNLTDSLKLRTIVDSPLGMCELECQRSTECKEGF